MSDREHIPNELQRQLMLEVGYRCPLCKQTEPLVFEHIEEYSDVKKHEFTNMIVLCASCHGRKKDTSNPRHINRTSLKKLKQNLMLLNGRYSDLERRIIDHFIEILIPSPNGTPATLVHHTLGLLVRNLEHDGLVTSRLQSGGIESVGFQGVSITNDQLLLVLTPQGRAFLENLSAVRE